MGLLSLWSRSTLPDFLGEKPTLGAGGWGLRVGQRSTPNFSEAPQHSRGAASQGCLVAGTSTCLGYWECDESPGKAAWQPPRPSGPQDPGRPGSHLRWYKVGAVQLGGWGRKR